MSEPEKEGKLYKQIREQSSFCEKCVSPCNKVQGVITCGTVKMFLNEAKKDIPKLKPILVFPLIPTESTGDITTDILNGYLQRERQSTDIQQQIEANAVKYIKDCQAWFKKYFGEAETKL